MSALKFKHRGFYRGPAALFIDPNGRPKAIIVADSIEQLRKAWMEVTGVKLDESAVQMVDVTNANPKPKKTPRRLVQAKEVVS